MPKVFMIEPAKNHLEKPEVSYCHSKVAKYF